MGITSIFGTLRGHVAEGFWVIVPESVPRRHPRNRKVCKTRLTVLSDQDVALDALSISMRVYSILHFTYRTDTTMQNTGPMKVREAAAHLCKLLQAWSGNCPHQLRVRPRCAYKHQTIGTWVHLGILSDVPIRHPRTHDANRKRSLRHLNDREHIRMRIELAPFDHTAVCLVRSELSAPQIEGNGRRTCSTLLRLSRYDLRTTLMHTDSPWYSPFQMSVKPSGL